MLCRTPTTLLCKLLRKLMSKLQPGSLSFGLSALLLLSPAKADPAIEAKAVLERVAGQSLPQVQVNINADINVDSKANTKANTKEQFSINSQNGQLLVSASSPIAATYGAYQYLQQQGQLHVSWEGKRVNIPAQFAAGNGLSGDALFRLRAYMNVCTFGYSTPFWDWSRWQQEIDWMALHGINQPLAMEGQEYIWQQLWREFGLTDAELAGFFSAPTVAPWQRMGNIENHLGPLPQSWITKKKDLQLQILTRMQALGMQPVLPAFSGYVPKAFKQRFPQAKINRMEPWSGFDRESYWLDPADPLFKQVAKRFLELYQATYPVATPVGQSQFYLADAFNEMLPPLTGDVNDPENRDRQLADYGQALYQSIAQVQPDATWVLQGWMFGDHAKFWQPSAVKAFLSKVPKDKTLVHDIGNDRFDVWQSTSAYAGAQWVFGFIHNYGGSNPVYGDLGFYQQQVKALAANPAKGALTGYGAFPEGIENNSLVYDFIYDQAWQLSTAPQSVDGWIGQYLQARYGKVTPELLHSWQLLEQALYQTKYWGSRWWEGSAGAYLLMKRPQRNFAEFGEHAGDPVKLRRALNSLLLQAPQYADAPLFQHDVLEFVRHYLSIELDKVLQQSIRAYQQGQVAKADGWLSALSSVVLELDGLLGAQPQSLNQWLTSAVAYGDNPAESAQYLQNAKMLLTVWGGSQLKDYASRAWQGMYAGFYLPRWQLFFNTLQQQPQISDAELNTLLRDFELQWTTSAELFPTRPVQQPLAQAPQLLQRLDQLNSAAGVALIPKKALATHQGARP